MSVFLCRPLPGARSAQAAGFSIFYLVYNFSITGNQTGFASSLPLRAIPIRSRTVWVYLLLHIPSIYYGNISLINTHFSTCNELTVHNDKMPSCVEKCCVFETHGQAVWSRYCLLAEWLLRRRRHCTWNCWLRAFLRHRQSVSNYKYILYLLSYYIYIFFK